MINGVTWDIKRFVRYTIVRTDRQDDSVSEKRIGEFESLDDAQLVSALLQDDEEADAEKAEAADAK